LSAQGRAKVVFSEETARLRAVLERKVLRWALPTAAPFSPSERQRREQSEPTTTFAKL